MTYDDRPVATNIRVDQPSATPASGWKDTTDPALGAPSDDHEPASAAPRSTSSRAVREIVETLLLALVIFVGVRLLVLNFRVDGASMVPNLHDREMLLVNRNAYLNFDLNEVLDILPGDDRDSERLVYPFDPPERGDIVVFDPPTTHDKPYIKRVIGLPGETISFEGGDVYIDGTALDESYIDDHITECDGGCTSGTVPPGHVYVLGDNRDNSSDSRQFGFVEIDDIIGKAWFTYWPFDDLGLVPHEDYPGFPER
jgi:signal peptidase I